MARSIIEVVQMAFMVYHTAEIFKLDDDHTIADVAHFTYMMTNEWFTTAQP